MQVKFYKEIKTNNVIILNNGTQLESSDFQELKENTQENAFEKHLPVYQKKGQDIFVKVGSIEHPMTEEHQIMWIAQVTDDTINIVNLSKESTPEAKFAYIKGSKIYAYCNLHGLWQTKVK